MGYILKESYNFSENSLISVNSASTFFAQTFTASSSYQLGKITFRLCRFSTQGNYEISIKSTSGGFPSGPDLAVVTVDGSILPEDSVGIATDVILPTPVNLISGNVYAIILKNPTTDGSTAIRMAAKSNTVYTTGKACTSTNSGSTWGNVATGNYDFWFNTYELPVRSKGLVHVA